MPSDVTLRKVVLTQSQSPTGDIFKRMSDESCVSPRASAEAPKAPLELVIGGSCRTCRAWARKDANGNRQPPGTNGLNGTRDECADHARIRNQSAKPHVLEHAKKRCPVRV